MELYKKNFMNQKMMQTVVLALLPIALASIYFFGLRVLLLYLVVFAAGILTEGIFVKKRNKNGKISEAVLVTCLLYTMTLPPSTPFWIGAVGIIFGIIFAKEVFGGFGRNVFNPALAARAFVYVNFPAPLTIVWNKSLAGGLGGITRFLGSEIEAVSQATPMLLFRDSQELLPIKDLLIGNVAGVIGETSAILIILAGAYLIYKKVASWEIMAGSVIGFSGLSFILRAMGNSQIPSPIYGMLIGGFLFGTVFMATDPITAPKTKKGKWFYGLMIGAITIIIRGFALFAGGMMFAILIMNSFVPIIDEAVRAIDRKKKAKKEEVIA